MRFFEYSISGDTAEHAEYGVGPATDYETPEGTVIDAPFAGYLAPFWTDEGGNSLRLDGVDEIFVAQHLAEWPAAGDKAWQEPIALSGNTGSSTTGPHVHCYIIIKATGQRISFSEWLRDYVTPGNPVPTPPPAPTSPRYLIGRELDLDGWCWYDDAWSADNTVNAHGGARGGGTLLEGRYWINDVSDGGSFYVTSQANGKVWVHSSAIANLVP